MQNVIEDIKALIDPLEKAFNEQDRDIQFVSANGEKIVVLTVDEARGYRAGVLVFIALIQDILDRHAPLEAGS